MQHTSLHGSGDAAGASRANGLSRRGVLLSGGSALAAAGLAAGPASLGRAQPSAGAKPFRVDVHHHISPPSYITETYKLQQPPTLAWTPERSLEDMDKAGVAVAITSITTPGVWLGDDEQGRHLARDCNEYAARLAADHPGRFGFFAALPLPDREGSLREIAHALDVLKADGVALLTNYRDRWLGDPAFDEVMAELDRRKAVVYTHPEAPACCRDLATDLYNNAVIEYGTDTTRAIANLMFRGTTTRYPEIRWIFSHGGGTAPFLAERLIRTGANREIAQRLPPHGVLGELRRFHYDTAQASYPSTLAALTRLAPISRILWGTDFPFRRGAEYVQQLAEYGFSEDDLRKIDRDNAVALIPRLASL
jgi:predicted TIM-barrel fold metal-dependent hydrolase